MRPLVFSAIISPVTTKPTRAEAARNLRTPEEELPPMLYLHQNKHHQTLSTILSALFAGNRCAIVVREEGADGV